jgi:hypothetical protein
LSPHPKWVMNVSSPMARKIVTRTYDAMPPVAPVEQTPQPAQSLVKVKPSQLRGHRSAPTPARPASPPAALMAIKSFSKTPSKSDFIRSLPRSVTAGEVVAQAKKLGLTITTAMVYSVRARPIPTRGRGRPRKSESQATPAQSSNGAARASAKPQKASAPAVTRRVAPSVASVSSLSSDDREMARLILSVGLDRAEQLLGQLRRALNGV